ncbi:MAG: ATP-dependent Zn protease [Thainema sp.]
MNQTSINLIAITIFGLTMSSLLGPMLHISPVIPAIATVSILGVATVDSFSFQGRGGTLLLDWLKMGSAEERERVLHHEAGHFLVAHLLEIPVTDYSLSAWEAFRRGLPGQGGVIFSTGELEQEIEQGQLSAQLLNRYSMVWMAGIAAEMLVYNNAQGGKDDRQNFRILWTQLQRPLSECEARQRWSALQAKTLLEKHRDAYDALVTAMQERLPVEECRSAIATHLPAEPSAS